MEKPLWHDVLLELLKALLGGLEYRGFEVDRRGRSIVNLLETRVDPAARSRRLLVLLRQLRRTVRLQLRLPLLVESGYQVHESDAGRHLLDLLLVAAVALAHNVAIELQRAEEAHLGVVN